MIKTIWVLAVLAGLFFVWYYLVPYLRSQWILFSGARTLRKIAKNNKDKDTKEQLQELANMFDEVRKNENLGD